MRTLRSLYIIGFLSFGIAAFVVFIYALSDIKMKKIVTFAAASAGTVASVASAVYVGISLKQSVDTQEQMLLLNASNNSIAYIQRWNDNFHRNVRTRDLASLVANTSKKDRSILVKREMEDDKDLRIEVISTLSFLEEMALAVQKGLVNEEIIKEFFTDIVQDYMRIFESWIYQRRVEKAAPNLYSALRDIYSAWN
ncbi:MAG: DUF4760 domain-containing protein [Cyanobacteria bacterium P01_F01_bin.53]